MNNQKKLDFATIAIILVSIMLILSGFFLLNKNVKSNKDTKELLSESSIAPITSKNTDLYDVIKSIESSSKSSTQSSEITKSSSSSASSSSLVSSSSSVQTTSSSAPTSKLGESEAIIKIESENGDNYRIEVIDTGFKNGTLWTIGKKFNINLVEFSANVGNTYKVTGISESPNSANFDLITENK